MALRNVTIFLGAPEAQPELCRLASRLGATVVGSQESAAEQGAVNVIVSDTTLAPWFLVRLVRAGGLVRAVRDAELEPRLDSASVHACRVQGVMGANPDAVVVKQSWLQACAEARRKVCARLHSCTGRTPLQQSANSHAKAAIVDGAGAPR